MVRYYVLLVIFLKKIHSTEKTLLLNPQCGCDESQILNIDILP